MEFGRLVAGHLLDQLPASTIEAIRQAAAA
jgi:hypothetical protein